MIELFKRFRLRDKILVLFTTLQLFLFIALGVYIYFTQRSKLLDVTNKEMMTQVNLVKSVHDNHTKDKFKVLDRAIHVARHVFTETHKIRIETDSTTRVMVFDQYIKEQKVIEMTKFYTQDDECLNETNELTKKIGTLGGALVVLAQRVDNGFVIIGGNLALRTGERVRNYFISSLMPLTKLITLGSTFKGMIFIGDNYYDVIAEPLYIRGNIQGFYLVAQPVFDYEFYKGFFSDLKYYESGYPMIIDSLGKLIVHREYEGDLFTDTAQLINQLKESRSGHFLYTDARANAKKHFYYFTDVRSKLTLAIDVKETDILGELTEVKYLIVIGIILSLIVSFWATSTLTSPLISKLGDLVKVMNSIANGELVEVKINAWRDEITLISESVNKLVQGRRKTAEYAEALGRSDYSYSFTPLSDKDVIGNALLKAGKNLLESKALEDKKQADEQFHNWANEGKAQFGEIMRKGGSDIRATADLIINTLVKFVDAAQGAIYLYNDAIKGAEYLDLLAAYASGRKKLIEKRIYPGEGIIGACIIEKNTSYINSLPEDYTEIESGLGSSKPKSLLVVPLKMDNVLLGVIELTSFKDFETHQLDFVENIIETIGSSLSIARLNATNQVLLEDAQRQISYAADKERKLTAEIAELNLKILKLNKDNTIRESEVRSLLARKELELDSYKRRIEALQKIKQ